MCCPKVRHDHIKYDTNLRLKQDTMHFATYSRMMFSMYTENSIKVVSKAQTHNRSKKACYYKVVLFGQFFVCNIIMKNNFR